MTTLILYGNRLNKCGLNIIFFILLFLAVPSVVHSQTREPQNIYRVRVGSRYIIEDGKRTPQFFAIEQQIRDSMDRMHTEIFYDWETHYPNNYRWNSFDGQTKYKSDFFENEKLVRTEEYTYTNEGLLHSTTVKAIKDERIEFVVKEVYTYNAEGKITQTEGFNEKGKRGFRAKYKYDAFGTEIERKVKGKKNIPIDSILYLTRTVSYDSLGRISTENLIQEKANRGRNSQHKHYAYDAKGNLEELILKDANGNTLYRYEYQYRPDNRVRMKNVYNLNDELIECVAWRYEIYKTSDRRHRVLE